MDAIGEAHPEMRAGDEALAKLFTHPAEMARTRLMLRYLTTAERAYNKAYADLTKVQSERRKQKALAEKNRRFSEPRTASKRSGADNWLRFAQPAFSGNRHASRSLNSAR